MDPHTKKLADRLKALLNQHAEEQAHDAENTPGAKTYRICWTGKKEIGPRDFYFNHGIGDVTFRIGGVIERMALSRDDAKVGTYRYVKDGKGPKRDQFELIIALTDPKLEICVSDAGKARGYIMTEINQQELRRRN